MPKLNKRKRNESGYSNIFQYEKKNLMIKILIVPGLYLYNDLILIYQSISLHDPQFHQTGDTLVLSYSSIL